MNIKELKKFIAKNESDVIIFALSFITLIIGSFVIGFGRAFLIILVLDTIIYFPNILNKIKKSKNRTNHYHTSSGNNYSLKKEATPNKKSFNNSRASKNSLIGCVVSKVKQIDLKRIKRGDKTMKITDFKDNKSVSDNNLSRKIKNSKIGKNLANNKKRKKIIRTIILGAIVLFIAIAAAFTIFMIDIIARAPKFDAKKLYAKESSIIYDKDGNVVTKIGSQAREKVTYDDLPEVLVDAIIATEDSRFFEHNGFDLPRFLKAGFGQALGRNAGGASTLTMQIVKNHFTSTTSTGMAGIKRKFTDIYMSIFQVERNYSKKEIMEFYVNAPYLGSGAWGVEQACQTYFGKSVKDINLSEAAMIAGLFQAPNSYDPNKNPEYTEKRRETVLYLMERHGYITKKEHEAASKMDVGKIVIDRNENTINTSSEKKYQAFIDTVIEEVTDDIGYDPYSVSMKIYTTLDPNKQKYVDDIMSGKTFTWENDAVDAGIMVLDVKNGEITAVGAGRNRKGARSFNNATMIKRQIGSTAKPLYDYGPGIEYENWSTYTPFVDEPHTYSNGTKVENWDRTYSGFMSMREALAASRNIPALKAFQANKNSNIKKFVKALGLSPEIADNGVIHEAHALGGYNGESPLTVAAAYAAFSNGGYYITPHSYTKIIFRESGEEKEKEIKKTRAMSEETAYMMTSLLQSSAQKGLGAQANVNGAIFGAKTGTSNYDAATIKAWNMKGDVVNDLWVDGISPDYAISVWYGYPKINARYHSTSYTISHRRLFQAVAKGIFKNGSNWTKPAGVSEVKIEYGSNPAKLASDYTPSNKVVTELFKKGTEPTESSNSYKQLENVSDLKASVNGDTLTLTWTAAKPLSDVDTSTLGEFGYEIYAGNKLIGFTSSTKYTISLNSNSASSYTVKTAYKNSSNKSSGVSVNVSVNKSKIEVSLNGQKSSTISQSDSYSDPGITVTNNGSAVNSAYTTSVTFIGTDGVERSSSLAALESSNREAGTYIITYTITVDGYTGSPQVRTVIVQ